MWTWYEVLVYDVLRLNDNFTFFNRLINKYKFEFEVHD